MRIDLSEEQALFQETVRRFVETETPVSRVREIGENPDGFDYDWWRQAAGLGWTSLLVPEDLGGGSISDDGVADLAIVAEEVGRGVAPGPLLPVNVVAASVARSGSTDQQTEILPGLLDGRLLGAWCYHEPSGGWWPEDVGLEAQLVDGGFRLEGTKQAVEGAVQAHYLLVTARVDGALTQFLVPADSEGIRIVPQQSLDLVRRFGEVHFDGVDVGPDCLLGQVGGAIDDVRYQFHIALVLQAAEMAGASGRVFEFTLEYSFDRFSFGRPLASYQALKHRFADMKLWLETGYATTDQAAIGVSRGDDAARLASVAKSYVGDRSVEIIQDCVQMHGGIGVTWEHDIHLYLRRAAVDRELFGSPEDHLGYLGSIVDAEGV
ncbi:acyl-CoA/acyl-ACP dehydrogenase [bacterium]|nr:acyl-CoA/acyl-ACP dehydrogenase [bacterium]